MLYRKEWYHMEMSPDSARRAVDAAANAKVQDLVERFLGTYSDATSDDGKSKALSDLKARLAAVQKAIKEAFKVTEEVCAAKPSNPPQFRTSLD